MYTSILIIVFIGGLLLRFPIAFSLGLSCLAYLVIKGIPLVILPMKLYSGIDVFVLLSIPGFILAGNLMNEGGLTEKIISFCNHILGHIRGGLALANIGASMLFAGISGTAVSDTASIGAIMIPAMKKEGYSSGFSCAVTASSSTVGPIIPPSVPMIIAATLSGLSVGKLFLASAIPGLILGVGLMLITYYISVKNAYPKHPRSSFETNCQRIYRYLLVIIDDHYHFVRHYRWNIYSHRSFNHRRSLCLAGGYCDLQKDQF